MIIRENIPISELVTMRIGGNARYVFELEDKEDIKNLIQELKNHNIDKWYFLGAGANTFATDAGFDGAVIINKIANIIFKGDGNKIHFKVSAGMDWDFFVEKTATEGCTGIECLAGIPGTVGAAPVQNIGAYGQEVATTITKIHALDMEKDELVELDPSECDFSYRHSIFNSTARGRYYIYEVDFTLEKGEIKGELYGSLQKYLDDNNITSREPKVLATAVRKVRDSKLPDPKEIASSGSFFKNVYVDESKIAELDEKGIPHHGTKVNTGWLIENSGLKGKIFHGFKVSDKAALVLINESGKSYEDLQKAVKEISDIVEAKYGFKLEQEPNVIGK